MITIHEIRYNGIDHVIPDHPRGRRAIPSAPWKSTASAPRPPSGSRRRRHRRGRARRRPPS